MFNNLAGSNLKLIVPLVLLVFCAIFVASRLIGDPSQGAVVNSEKSTATSLPSLTEKAASTTLTATGVNSSPSNNTSTASFSLSAVGDVNAGSRPPSYVKEFGYPYKNIRELLRSTDLTFGNLECALSSRGKPIPGKRFTFRGSPQDARFLRGTGFNMLSVANNHSKDYGDDAFLDTLDFLEQAQITFSGGGKNTDEAYQPKIIEVRGKKVAFLAFSGILPMGFTATQSTCGVASIRDKEMVIGAIKEAKSEAESVIVSIHWGKELDTHPSEQQIGLAHRLVDEGADVILGHHPHVVQGVEMYKGRLIAYSLGNFMFSPGNPSGRQSVILTTRIEKDKVTDVRIYPVYIDGIRPQLISGKQGEDWLNEVASRSQGFKTSFEIDDSSGYLSLKLLP